MRSPSGFVRLIGLLTVTILLVTACGTGEDEPGGEGTETGTATATETAAEGTYSVYICEPQSLIPTNNNETCGAEVTNALFTGLVAYDEETSEPMWGDECSRCMAESITTEDQQTWTITIKDGWTFHNGEEVTAQSFVDSWNFGAYAPNAQNNNYFFENIQGHDELNPQPAEGETEAPEPDTDELDGLTVVDETTFEVELAQPFSQFPLTIGYTAFYPMPSAAMEDPEAYNEAPIGNGPFQMDGSWQHDEQIAVTRYEDYAAEPAVSEGVEFRIYADVNTAYQDLRAGSLDIMDSVPPEQIDSAQQEFGDRFIQRESSSYTYLGLPHYGGEGEFADDRLGRAMSMAIDRQAIIDAVFSGTRTPAGSVVSPVVNGARDNPCGEDCQYNPDQARQLWNEAGGASEPITIWFNSGAGHEDWIEAVANQWQQNLGLEQDIQFQSLQFADYLDRLQAGDVQGPYRLGWVMDYPSMQNYLEPMHATNGSTNLDGYSNSEVDELIDQGNAAQSVEEGIELYQQAEDLILDDWHHIPMWFGQVQAAHSENVSNVVVDAFTRINTPDIEVSG